MIKDIAIYLLVIFAIVVVSTSVHAETTLKNQTSSLSISKGDTEIGTVGNITGSWGRGKK